MRRWLWGGLFVLILLSQVSSVRDETRQNLLVNGSKYKYQSYFEMRAGKYVPLFGLGLMMVPDGEVPVGLLGSVAAIFSSGYQTKAKFAQTGPQEILIAKEVKRMWGKKGSSSQIKAEVVDKSKLKPPEEE